MEIFIHVISKCLVYALILTLQMISNHKRHQRSFLKGTNHNYLVILFIFLMILSWKSVSKCKILTIISKFLHFFVLSFLCHTDPIRRLFTNRTKSDQSEPWFVLLPPRGLLLFPNSRVEQTDTAHGGSSDRFKINEIMAVSIQTGYVYHYTLQLFH